MRIFLQGKGRALPEGICKACGAPVQFYCPRALGVGTCREVAGGGSL